MCGEIMTYDDLKEYGSEAAVKAVCDFLVLVPCLDISFRPESCDNKASHTKVSTRL